MSARLFATWGLGGLLLATGCSDGDSTVDGSDAAAVPNAAQDATAHDASLQGATTQDGSPSNNLEAGSLDAASAADSGVIPWEASASCSAQSEAIRTAAANTITVSPGAAGTVLVGGSAMSLRQVVSDANEGDTILLEDGTYTFDESDGSSYTGLYFTTPNITLRSASGDADAVILDSNYVNHGQQTAPITIDAPGVVLAGFTVRRSIFHLVHLWANADGAVLHDLRLLDGGQQFVKASPSGDGRVDDVSVSCSVFRMTANGRENVWGYGASDGSTRCYTGGIDTHRSRDWHVADNLFDGIYCDAGGTPRPIHGKEGSARENMTYTGGLAEHAIHMWDSEQGSAHLVERNHIVNCARGIGIGLADDVYGSMLFCTTVP